MNLAAFLSTHQWIIAIAVIWTLPWKGAALWRAARNQSFAWFIILLIVNTLGILEIIYIFIFSKKTEIGIKKGEARRAATSRTSGNKEVGKNSFGYKKGR